MQFKVTTDIASEPVSLAEARLHLRLADDETGEDTLISTLITVAREIAEHYTGRAFGAKTFEAVLDAFPLVERYFDLPIPSVTTLTSIKYDDTNGAEQTLSTSFYTLSGYGEARRVNLNYGYEWPATQVKSNAVRAVFTAGYATAPKAVKSAILLLVGHLFENRQEVVTDVRIASLQIPVASSSLLDTIKVYGV